VCEFTSMAKTLEKNPKVTKVVDTAADYRTNWWEHVEGVRAVQNE